MTDFVVLNLFFFLFPILIYLIYVVYANTMNIKVNKLFFGFAMITSIYLILKYSAHFNYDIDILKIVLLICLLQNKKVLSILVAIFLSICFKEVYNYDIYILLLKSFIQLIFFFVILKNNNKKYKILGFLIIEIMCDLYYDYDEIIYLVIFNLFYAIIAYLLSELIRKSEQIINIHSVIKSAEEEKKLRDSLFKVTHEIKNPIAVCKGYLDMIDLNNKKKVDKYIPIIKSEITRTLSLLDDYLDFSRVKIEKDIIDIIMLLEDTLRSMGVLLKEKNINTIFDISDEEVYIIADYNRLKQVLVNIIKNSMEARIGNEDLNISVKTEISKNNIKIIISDNGIGMTNEELDKLGEPFYTTKANGTGIGVNLSKEIIEKHNGTLTYESKKFSGTSVIIDLPVDPELNCY